MLLHFFMYRKPSREMTFVLERHTDGKSGATSLEQWFFDHPRHEAEHWKHVMGLNFAVNEDIDMIVDKPNLNIIGETIDTTFWPKKTNIKLVTKIFQLPQISSKTAMAGVDVVFCNQESR